MNAYDLSHQGSKISVLGVHVSKSIKIDRLINNDMVDKNGKVLPMATDLNILSVTKITLKTYVNKKP